eukprot:symbB.v1.2.019354.t1/scaffold1564.1/size111405/5
MRVMMRLAFCLAFVGEAVELKWEPWETTTTISTVPPVPMQVLPVTPKEFAKPAAELSEAAADARISTERLSAAKAGRKAYEAELQAWKAQVAAAKSGDGLTAKVEKVRKLRAKTMEASRMTGRLVAQIPAAIERGVQKGVEEVAAEALKKLEEEKAALVKKKSSKESATAAAPGGAPPAPAPAPAADTKRVATVRSYAVAAQELVQQSNMMKQRAVELGNQALEWQARENNLAKAQELQLAANELMDKAEPMGKEASIYQDVAQLMSKEAGAMKDLGFETSPPVFIAAAAPSPAAWAVAPAPAPALAGLGGLA